MTKPTVLIVGAGALGVVVGYHLTLAGAAVTFLVRPARLDAMKPPQLLYCYDDAQLKQYSDYQTIAAVGEVAALRFDYVIVSLDGASCRSAEGTKLLHELGDALRTTSAIVIIAGVGVREHYLQTTRLPAERLMEGTLGCLSYQVQRTTLPLHPPTDPAQLAKASLAYHHFPNKVGYMLAGQPAPAAKEFSELYNRCGVSRCSVMNPKLFSMVCTAFFPMSAICDLAGWPDAKSMAGNQSLLALGSGSMREIIGLRHHGWLGKLVRPFMSENMLARLMSKLEQDALPLDFSGFNRFHHGDKVRAQDLQVMVDCLQSGLANGQPMTALKDLVQRYQAHCAQLT